MVIIPFNLPKIGASSESDVEAFQELGVIKKTASAALGWIISLGKKFKTSGVQLIKENYLPKVFAKLQGVEPRSITGYSILLYFVDEVWVMPSRS